LSAYALRIKDEDILLKSSSGGAFSILANYVISKGGIVYGASYNKDLVVTHSRIDSQECLYKLQGSKYSQSNLQGIFRQVRNDLKKLSLVLFSGTPCQIDALRSFLRKPYENLLTVDVICHSVPSPIVFKDYKSLLESEFKQTIVDINMKDKTLGWGVDYIMYYLSDRTSCTTPPNYPNWISMFESGLFSRESCFDCQYTDLDRVSDFTIGDFWDFDNHRPEIRSKKGTSVMLLNSNKAIQLFEELKGKAYIWELSKEEYMQPRLEKQSVKPHKYESFWSDYLSHGLKRVVKRYFAAPKDSMRMRIKMIIQKIIKKV
jgi:coenzyme F420-reducing hydrogenase beta subunit